MEEVDVKIFKADKRGVDPTYATEGSAGFDLYAIEDMIIKPGDTVKVRTGLVIEVPYGYALMVHARSGIAAKTPLRLANGVGVIDSDYRGEVIVLMHNSATLENHVYPQFILTDGTKQDSYEYGYLPVGTVVIRAGDRIAQGVLTQVPKAKFIKARQVSKTERGEGGLGSTGK